MVYQLGFNPQHWVALFFFFFFSIPVLLFMGSLSLQTIVNTWQHLHLFFKVCTKGYVVNSCLTPPLNTGAVTVDIFANNTAAPKQCTIFVASYHKYYIHLYKV